MKSNMYLTVFYDFLLKYYLKNVMCGLKIIFITFFKKVLG